MRRFMDYPTQDSRCCAVVLRILVAFCSTLVCLILIPCGSGASADDSMMTPTSAMSTPSKASVRWHGTLRSGWLEARRRKVPMVIYISSKQCAYCDAMKRDTWCDRTVEQRMAKEFVAIHLTPEQNADTLGRIEVNTYPMTLIGLPQGKIIGHRKGYQPVAEMHRFLNGVVTR